MSRVSPLDPPAPNVLPPDFDGRVPLFPLPDCVHFPHTLLPLHVFEPRYRAMTRDALAGDRLIAVARLVPGLDSDHLTDRPPIHHVVTVGRIMAEEELDDGRFYLVLRGITRARVRRELPTDAPYRVAELEPLADRRPARDYVDRDARRRQLAESFQTLHPEADLCDVLRKAFGTPPALGMLSDVIASVLHLPPGEAQELLDQVDVDVRADTVLRHLGDRLRAAGFRKGRVTSGAPAMN